MPGPLEVASPWGTLGGPPPVRKEWPSYGADLANSRTVAGGPAATSVPTLTPAWRVDVADGDFTGTPVVSGGVVFVGSNGGVIRAITAVPRSGHPAGTVLWKTSVAP